MASFITKLRNRSALVLLAAVLSTAAPVPSARACPVCGANRTEQPRRSSWALLGTTAAMMVLPFAMAGGFVWWLRKNL
jgi:hypothetical protein